MREVNKSWLNYEFCCPHMFQLGQGRTDVRSVLEYAGERLEHVHIADVYNHVANVGNRYIVNPPGVDARIHQHNEIGNGEVPAGCVPRVWRENATCSDQNVPRRLLHDWRRRVFTCRGTERETEDVGQERAAARR